MPLRAVHFGFFRIGKGERMKKSPMKVVELCVYVLIIILAVIWMFTGGKFYMPPSEPSIAIPATLTDKLPITPPATMPRGEVFPEY